MSQQTPQQIAERCAEALWPGDRAAQGMGMDLVEIGPGQARLRMTVREDMVNCHGICHGGYIFAIADTAFAYACNSYNQRAVASGVDINFLAPAQLGDTLTAHGHARQQGGRSGVYDIEVANQDGKQIALFRGRSTRIKGPIFDNGNDKP
jgi:acyl-CoA thioesterase